MENIIFMYIMIKSRCVLVVVFVFNVPPTAEDIWRRVNEECRPTYR